MTQDDKISPTTNNGGPPLSLPENDGDRPVLVAYPLSYARRERGGRLVLDPARLPAPAADQADNESEAEAAGQTVSGAELSLLLLAGAVTLILDQISKRLIEARLPLYTESIPVETLYPYFRFTHTANYGAAFGIFQSGGMLFGVVAAIVAVVILYYNYVLPPGQRLLRLALGLQLGGALGNLIDRLRLGYVTDFMDVDVSTIVHIPYISDWPIFNMADMAIVGGVILLAWLMITEGDRLGGAQPAARTQGANDAGGPQKTDPDDGREALPGVFIYDEPARATSLPIDPAPERVSATPDEDDMPWNTNDG